MHTLCERGKIIARIVTFLRITRILTSRIKFSFVNRLLPKSVVKVFFPRKV